MQARLENQLSQQGVGVLSINLYDLCLDILKNGDWEWLIQTRRPIQR